MKKEDVEWISKTENVTGQANGVQKRCRRKMQRRDDARGMVVVIEIHIKTDCGIMFDRNEMQ